MKTLLKFLTLLGLAAVAVRADQVTWGDTDSFGLGTSTGVPMPAGDLVEIGTFDINNATIQVNQHNLSFLQANFVDFATSVVGAGAAGGSPGYWTQDSNAPANTPLGPGINGDQIYLWAFNAVSAASATEQGIYTSTAANWVFPSDTVVPDTTAIDLDQVNEIVVGGFGVGTSSASGSTEPLFNTAVILNSIPEPSTYDLLGGLVALGLAVVRRRRTAV